MLTKPNFPAELVTEILTSIWLSLTLSNAERIHLLTTLPLVSRLFYHTFHYISSRDVYISSADHASHFLYIMQRGEAFIRDNRGELVAPHSLCRSLNFELVNEAIHPPVSQRISSIENFSWSEYMTDDDHEQTKRHHSKKSTWDVLSDTLYMLSAVHPVDALPNLRRISISSVNYLFNDIFTNYTFSSFPRQVQTLELRYAFSPLTPSFLVDALKEHEDEDDVWVRRGAHLPFVKELMVLGAGSGFVRDMLRVCKNARTIVTDTRVESTDKFATED